MWYKIDYIGKNLNFCLVSLIMNSNHFNPVYYRPIVFELWLFKINGKEIIKKTELLVWASAKKLEQNNSMQIDRWWKCNLTKIMYISQSHELEPMPFYAITGQITGSTYTLTPSWYFAPNFVKATFEFSFTFFSRTYNIWIGNNRIICINTEIAL